MNLGSIWAEMGLDTSKLDKGLMDASAKLAAADKQVNTMGAKLTQNSTKFMAAGGIMVAAAGAAGTAVVKMASEFETSMRNVNSIMQVSEDELADISAEVLDISKKLPQSATTLANGLYDIASSGFAGADGLEVLEASARAAAAGMTTTEVSAKGVTAVLNAYGYSAEEADRVSDTMFRTVDKGVISFEELSSNIGEVVGTSNLAKIGFEEVSGALGYITTKGYGAAEATTALNRLMLGIIDPSDELAEVLAKAGYESGEFALQQVGLMGVLKLMDAKANGSMAELKALAGDIRAAKAAGALLGNGLESLTEYMSEFEDTTGATNIALEEQSKSLSYQMDLLKSSLSAIGIELGNKFIPKVALAVDKISEFVDKNSDMIVSLGDIGIKSTLAVGGVLLLAGAVGKLRAAALAHPIGLVAAAIAGLNIAVASGVEKLRAEETLRGDIEASIMTGFAPLPEAINGFKNLAFAIGEYKEGNLSLRDALFASRREIEEQREAQEAMESGVYDTVKAYEEAITFVTRYGDSLPNASNQTAELVMALQNGEISVEAFTIGVENLRKQTRGGREDIDAATKSTNDYADKQELAKIKVDAHSGAQENAKYKIDETTKSIEEQKESIEQARIEFKNYVAEIFDATNAEADWQLAKIELNEAEKELQKIVDEGKEGTKEYWQAIQNVTASEYEYLEALQKVYIDTDTTKDKIAQAKDEFILWGIAAVQSGKMTREEFKIMAQEFGINIDSNIRHLELLQKAIDELHGKDVEIRIHQIETFEKVYKTTGSFKEAQVAAMPAMGGILTASGLKAFGGGGILRADYGAIVPQTGREVPILAHEGELILNSSQQGNLAEALWGVANGKGEVGGQPININVVAELDGQVIYEKTSQYIYNQSKINQAGAGIR